MSAPLTPCWEAGGTLPLYRALETWRVWDGSFHFAAVLWTVPALSRRLASENIAVYLQTFRRRTARASLSVDERRKKCFIDRTSGTARDIRRAQPSRRPLCRWRHPSCPVTWLLSRRLVRHVWSTVMTGGARTDERRSLELEQPVIFLIFIFIHQSMVDNVKKRKKNK